MRKAEGGSAGTFPPSSSSRDCSRARGGQLVGRSRRRFVEKSQSQSLHVVDIRTSAPPPTKCNSWPAGPPPLAS